MRRLSIAGMIGIVAAFAVGLAAMRSGSPLAFKAIYTLMLGILAIALLGALLGSRPRGAWLGLALFGWGYFLLVFVPVIRSEVGYNLVTWKLLDGLADGFHPQPAPPSGTNQPTPEYYGKIMAHATKVGYSRDTGEVMMCLLAGFVGSALGRLLYLRREGDARA